ncbi:hypothetical protein BJY52DRAFT_1212400 [Lactarius psammicola]|nr:hypothetical protein BJY52DRAFT_1212400 [Lactarius psammicola]
MTVPELWWGLCPTDPSSCSSDIIPQADEHITQEVRELANDPSTEYSAAPLEIDVFELHYTLRGPSGIVFGILPLSYPATSRIPISTAKYYAAYFQWPIRIEYETCSPFDLNNSAVDHEELWQPTWGVRTAIIGVQSFFFQGQVAMGIGALEAPSRERRRHFVKGLGLPPLQSVEPPIPPRSPTTERFSLRLRPASPLTTTTTKEKMSAEADASGVPTPAPAEVENVSVAPVVRSPEVEPATPHSHVDREPTRQHQSRNRGGSKWHDLFFLTRKRFWWSLSRPGGPASPPSNLHHQTRTHATTTVRPPMLLDKAICVLLVLVFALLCRRLF